MSEHLPSLNLAEFKSLYTTDEVYLLDFFADWCGPCQMLSPELVKLQPSFPTVKFRAINTDTDPDFAKLFGVRSIPAVFIVQFNGKSYQILEEFIGNKSPFEISQILNKALNKAKK